MRTTCVQSTYTLGSHVLKLMYWQQCLQNWFASEGLQAIVMHHLLLLLTAKYWTILTFIFLMSSYIHNSHSVSYSQFLMMISNLFQALLWGQLSHEHLQIALLTLNLSETPSVMLIVNSAILGVRNFPFLRSGSYSVFVLTTTFKKKQTNKTNLSAKTSHKNLTYSLTQLLPAYKYIWHNYFFPLTSCNSSIEALRC